MKQPLIDPTPEQLQRAFNRLRNAAWPATVQAAMADPRFEPRVTGLAVQLAREALQQGLPITTRPVLPVQRPPAVPALLRPRPSWTARDAAAGDLDPED